MKNLLITAMALMFSFAVSCGPTYSTTKEDDGLGKQFKSVVVEDFEQLSPSTPGIDGLGDQFISVIDYKFEPTPGNDGLGSQFTSVLSAPVSSLVFCQALQRYIEPELCI